ncbi:MAG: DUF2334 domain-containing protein [Bacteroidota bacterium]
MDLKYVSLIVRLLLCFVVYAVGVAVSPAQSQQNKRVLILFEGNDLPLSYARGDARQLAMLLGHFSVEHRVKAVNSYAAGEINNYDVTFFIGFSKQYDPPDRFLRDVHKTGKQIVWMNTGFDYFCKSYDVRGRFGFSFVKLDTVSNYNVVKSRNQTFTKGEPNLNIVSIASGKHADVLATAYSSSTRHEAPYIIRSGNFMYIADSPFASSTETDRYILFADMLHDILGEPHEENHHALLRIEDVDVFESPGKLRDIADMLSSKHIPFLVGIIPFFVDPEAGTRLSISDKPEFVDAIHYMVAHGATIVMHGVTHQYLGVTAVDYEFWDGSVDHPIKTDSKEYVERKLRTGLEECWKNNIYPLVWETPHYAASQLDYPVFGTFFSTCMEQRQVIDDINYGQYFPYIIEHDLYGQRIIPEDLGYIPLDSNAQVEEAGVHALLQGAKAQLAVRDGFASAFIHPFVDIRYIEEFVDGALDLGYTFMDVKNEQAFVKLKDRFVATGNQQVEITLADQYLRETWLRQDGEVDHRDISQDRIRGPFKKNVQVPEGQIYIAEPMEYREAELTWFEKLRTQTKTMWEGLIQHEQSFEEARVAILWDARARPGGGVLNDQASFVSAFRSLNIPVDTLAGDSVENLSDYNLLVVPYHQVDRLSNRDYDRIVQFVESGGNLITDGKNGLAEELGVRFAKSSIKVERMRDHLFPEDPLVLNRPDIMTRFEMEKNDEVLCIDERTDAPIAVGREYGEGKYIFLGIRFDPVSTGGYSRFPYLMEYVRSFFKLQPILKREHLEMYFDPGFRHNISVEDLVKRWTTEGIRILHVAGWHQYPTWSYDYGRLITLCHANGILVYAWLEPPQVSEKFWKGHPEWQEENYKKEAIRPSWRFLMALANPQCLDSVKTTYKAFLQEYDWDGVNLAELYYESDRGPQNPNLLTPMHPSAREEFRRKAGFDPALLFDSLSDHYWKRSPESWKSFEDYRVDELTHLHEEFLKMIGEVQSTKPHLETVVTAMDNLGNPELRMYFGVDINRIIELKKHYKFTLQVEDPQSEWSKDPRRYRQLAQRYQALSRRDDNVMVDLNILQFRNDSIPTPFPTLIQTGIEGYELVRSAATGADRFTIYSESSVRPQDLRMMSYASSARAELHRIPDGWVVNSPFPVVLDLPKEFVSVRTSKGDRLSSEQGMFLLPSGHDTLIGERRTTGPFTPLSARGQLLSLTGELTQLSQSSRSIKFSYRSAVRCIASFSHRPYALIVDGKELNASPMQGYHRFSVTLPPGEHECIAVLETTVSYGIDLTSFWSSWLIVAFGFISGAALFSFYAVVRFSRPQKPGSA